jgi:anti-anti-sigma regulatory factor
MSPVTIFVNGCSGVSVTGTLDATTVGDLNRTVSDFFQVEDLGNLEVLTLDLSTVTMCDEAARAAVRHAQAACADHSVALRVIPSDAVRYAMRRRD